MQKNIFYYNTSTGRGLYMLSILIKKVPQMFIGFKCPNYLNKIILVGVTWIFEHKN